MTINRFFPTVTLPLLFGLQLPLGHASASDQEKASWSEEHLLEQRESLIESNRDLRAMLDAVLLSIAKQIDVHDLDKNLGNESLESWISGVAGNPSNVNWEWNDCGESVGREPGEDYPVCVEARLELSSNKTVGINVQIATEKKGVTEPRLWLIYVQPFNGSTRALSSLTKLKEYLKGTRR